MIRRKSLPVTHHMQDAAVASAVRRAQTSGFEDVVRLSRALAGAAMNSAKHSTTAETQSLSRSKARICTRICSSARLHSPMMKGASG